MRNFKRFLAMALTMLMVLGCVSLSAFAFDDYKDGEYTAAVENLAAKGIIYGVSETEFDPDAPVQRWQAALFLARMASGLVTTQDQSRVWYTETNTTDFTDVEPHQYIGAIQYAANFNFIVGNGDGTFNPNGQIIFQDMLTMAVRALGFDVDSITGEPFGTAGYPWKYISAAVSLGLDKGLENVSYTAPLTRAQTAQLINNLFYTKSTTGHSYAVDVFSDYSREELNATYVVIATATSKINGTAKFAEAGKAVVASLADNGDISTTTATVDAALLPDGAVAGDSFRAYVDGSTIKYSVANVSTLTKLVAGDNNSVKDGDGNKVALNQVLIGTTAYNVVTDATQDGIVLYKVYDSSVPAKVTNTTAVVFDIGGSYGDQYFVRAYDDDGDGALDRGYIFKPTSGKIKAYSSDFNRKEDGVARYATPLDAYIRSFINYKTMASVATLADNTYVAGFYNYFTENFYYTEAVAPGTYTVTGVLTEMSPSNHTVTVNGKKYTVGTTYDGPFKYETVLADCQNLSDTLLNMTVRLVLSEDEDCVIKIETEETAGTVFGIVTVPTADEAAKAGKVVVKAIAYKTSTQTEIEIVAVNGTYGEIPEAGKVYAGYKDFNGKWMLYTDNNKIFALSSANANLSSLAMLFSYGQSYLTPGVTNIAYTNVYVATENTSFQIWNGTEMFTFKGVPSFDSQIEAVASATQSLVFYEYEEVEYEGHGVAGTVTNNMNGIFEALDDDDEHDYWYRNELKNVFVWNGEFTGSYTNSEGQVVTPSAVDYDDIIMIQSTAAGNAVFGKATVTTDAAELAAAQAVVGGTVSKVTKWANVYSVIQGKFVTVSTVNGEALANPTSGNGSVPTFYYVKNGVVIGKCELGNEVMDAKILKTSHITSYVLVQKADNSTELVTINGAIDGNTYMNWYGGMTTVNGQPTLVSAHSCTQYYFGAADCSDATAANTDGYPSAYVYVGALSSSPIVIFHDKTSLNH